MLIGDKLKILNINFDKTNYDDIFCILQNNIKINSKTLIDFPNAHICLIAQYDKNFSRIIDLYDLLIPDGIGVYYASKLLYGRKGFYSRTVSTDLWVKLFSVNNNYRFYLIGGANNSRERINNIYGGIGDFIIVNHECEPQNSDYDINLINSSKADILMVALGTPRQEEWIVRNKDLINVPIIIGVGSGLDLLSGVKKRAPLWMRKVGLEWFYRLFQEPGRLWKRYIIGIPVFMFHVFVQKAKLLLKKD